MLEVAGLESRYGRIPALAGIDLCVGRGELVALVGANGAGKSTLLRALSGVQPSTGGIFFKDLDLKNTAPEQRVALGLVHVPEGRQVFGPYAPPPGSRRAPAWLLSCAVCERVAGETQTKSPEKASRQT